MTERRKPNLGIAAGRRLCLGSARIIASPAATDGPGSTVFLSPQLSVSPDIGVPAASPESRYSQSTVVCTSYWKYSYPDIYGIRISADISSTILSPLVQLGRTEPLPWPDAPSAAPLIRFEGSNDPDSDAGRQDLTHRPISPPAPYNPFPLAVSAATTKDLVVIARAPRQSHERHQASPGKTQQSTLNTPRTCQVAN